ncbi:phosphatidylinositol-3-phosphatase SAC1-A [Coccinella septempunctata]|uniref:phosphatidylinositol-3-phosphatase SAC1-A n=1 Tax=Coccinella septempunctata TaxID=41139 RepID=UPI001D0689A0|nr:phosphatidylinositol-3-phosphatase SAC1-A [Coccinella septempunctata]XP_044746314.1 phosphatidylinositol-3-phosphatase SAC1-A [Coccinella septempunctata]XP_044746315.1 phosphatidylinositol-3-phosphatase SAC1-A [Coccinella septempunctata]
MNNFDVFNDLTLYITPENFYIQPVGYDVMVVIDRTTESITVLNVGQIPAANSKKDFCGFLGTINLLAGRYLVIATQRQLVGYIAGHAIWRLAKAELIPYCRSTLHLNQDQLVDNNTHIAMIEQVLSTPYLYFSYSYDLTHTLQRLHDIGPDFWSQSLVERADHRFMWNGNLLKGLKRPDLRNFCLPLLHGFISINQCRINGLDFTWALISRRGIYRAGTRLFRRGVDRDGNVANFVETEQIIDFRNDRASFVQIRGSIPLFWNQLPDLRYKPPPTILDIDPNEQNLACAKHLEATMAIYGKQVLIDLVDQHGSEGALERSFRDTVKNLNISSVKYEPFDFHSECRKMRWDRLSILMDRIAPDLEENGFFLILRDGSLSSLQEGVFRTNCVDCLDRTNVVQSMLAHRNLEIVLRKLQILTPGGLLESQISFEVLYKNVWADNADVISTQYSGTGALKTDFTRTGKRTKMGLIQDGVNSLMRYYKNNFTDGFRQDAIDLFLGNGEIMAPMRVERGWRYVTFPSVLLVAMAMFVASAVFPQRYSTESLMYLLFWGSMVAATATTIFRYGKEFIDRPRLTQI